MVSENLNLSSLSAKERKEAEEGGEVIHALTMKALLHRLDPKAFPISGDASSPEAKAAEMAKTIKPQAFAKLRPLIENNMHHAPEFSRIISSARGLNLGEVAPRAAEPEVPVITGTEGVGTYSRLNLIVRSLHCVEETDGGGSDEMILGGVLIGASAKTKVAHTIIRGGFDTGVRKEFLSPQRDFGTYNLNATDRYPKSFLAIFQLRESDGDDAAVAAGLEIILRMHSQIAEARHQFSAPLPDRIDRVGNSILKSLRLAFPSPNFPPQPIALTLNSQNHFGGPASGNLVTKDIRGLGGKYRIGYKWSLS